MLTGYSAHLPPIVLPCSLVELCLRADNRDDWIEVVDSSGTSGWGSICEGGVDVIPMACHHLDILKEPHVTDLARHIDGLLNALDK